MPPRAGSSSKPTAPRQGRKVTVTPPVPSRPQEESQAELGSAQHGHTSGEEFDFEAVEDNVSELGSLPQTQPTSKSARGSNDIKSIFKVIQTEEVAPDGQKVQNRVCTWCG